MISVVETTTRLFLYPIYSQCDLHRFYFTYRSSEYQTTAPHYAN